MSEALGISGSAAALVAWAGVYLYVGLYYGAVYWLRRERAEYRAFAGFCVSIALFSFASAITMDARSVADAVGAQHVMFLGLMPTMSFFVELSFRITDEPRPRLATFAHVFCGIGAGAALARSFFDPAIADPSYDWAAAGPHDRAIAELSTAGTIFVLGGVLISFAALLRLASHARRHTDIAIATVFTALGILAGIADLAARIFDLRPYNLASHAALLPVLGFSYVLVGRFTRVDAQLADRKEELARSYDHLRLAQEELVKKEQLAAVGELSAVIAHEVRNPLAIIKNAVGGLRRNEIAAQDAETLLSILDEETDRLNRLVNDLLAYAKPISPEAGQVDLRKLVVHAVELAAGGNRAISGIEIELEVHDQVDLVEGDEALLRHALINIVDNALQAMPMGGTLTIRTKNVAMDGRPSVAVEFHDTGEGMDTMVRNKARDPFFTTRESGTGLGLAIVDRVARAHGGRVELDSRHGQGTTVSFIVPRDRGSVAPS